ncbi:spore coat protein [Calidifontibacillus erzurumensis]|uniref:spore coat protein n=1 Tax=Calidifontibacillus erzurumensis TaxID=2741433 RepID=UPI0035B54A0B
MNQQLGAHELMEVHEVLTNSINKINHFQMLQPYCQDPQLKNILQNQLNFIINEYNSIVNLLNNRTTTGNATVGNTRPNTNFSPTYGLRNPSPVQPNTSINQMDDRDVASAMLGCHKTSATMKMHAALECADPQLRNILIQGAKNCADQAYEIWQYMNSKGYYQVPTFKDMTAETFTNVYQPVSSTINQMNQQNINTNYNMI